MAHEQQVFDFFSMPKVQLTETDPHRKLSQIHNITPRKDVRTSHCSEHGSNGIQYCSTPKKNLNPYNIIRKLTIQQTTKESWQGEQVNRQLANSLQETQHSPTKRTLLLTTTNTVFLLSLTERYAKTVI